MRYLKCLQLVTLVLFLFGEPSGQCCVNEYKTQLNGDLVLSPAGNLAPRGRFNANNRPYLLMEIHKADSVYRRKGGLEVYSDLGALLVYSGQYEKAKLIFQAIEKKTPGLYITAANLGTAYELLGKIDSALYWIKRAVEINPDAHRGSEWIHVKILEAKVKANGDENYLWTHSILSLDFGDEEVPENKTNLDLHELQDHLYDQLNERMSFVKPRDPVVGQLLFDLGNVFALTIDATTGLQVYQSAKEYGYSSALFEARKSYMEKLQVKADDQNKSGVPGQNISLSTLVLIGTLCIAGFVGAVFLFIRLRKRRQEKRSPKA